MEFTFNINELFPDEISLINNQLATVGTSARDSSKVKELIGEVIDVIGEASAKAQTLTKAITTKERFLTSNDRIYIKRTVEGCDSKVVGFIKIGIKNLFLFDLDGSYNEVQPLCVLDFYVHETMQRQGCGKQLFDFMLKCENVKPHQLAINRPSSKFISFLCKHYNLKQMIPQINKFVVFRDFFQGRQVTKHRRQWRYDNDDENYGSRFRQGSIGATQHSRHFFLESHSKSQVPKLPNINVSQNNSSSLDRKSNWQTKKDSRCRSYATEHQDNQKDKYFSTEVFNLSPSTSNFNENNCLGNHSSSIGHLSRKLQDTSWNIFGVSSSASKSYLSRDPSGVNQKGGTSLLW